jgi:hypothetical protein
MQEDFLLFGLRTADPMAMVIAAALLKESDTVSAVIKSTEAMLEKS